MRLEIGRTTFGIYLGEETSPNALPNLELSQGMLFCAIISMILFTFSLLTSLTSVLLNSLIIIATYLELDYNAGVGESGSHSDFLV